ncbi:hypothetical protein [Williamsia muralis]|uniref:Serine/threonine protein kinase n=1 Tax=Williamsia marianensis TaxID=85044 RepID=A0A2G3PST6_WILMA|nr:hypothetical protein [Williamsia marianensis]PHV68826.1 hypothetical protein CSW57_06655 [Williamsia marianensis]
MSGNFYPTPPPRSPWASPLVIGAIVAGVLVLALAVLLGFLFIPADEESSASGSSTTAPPPTTSQQVSTKTETVTATTPPITTPTVSTPRATPTVPGTDWQGFVSGPRCNAAGDPAVMIGQTARSNVVVCQVGTQVGRYYYKGLADGQSTELQFPTRSGDQFVAVNVDTTYEMTPAALTISTNGSVVAAEPMIYYWTN